MAPKRKQSRRPKGSGSIYQNKDGSWTAADTIDGRHVRRRAADRQAAEKHLEALQEIKRSGIKIDGGEQTVAAWLQTWYKQVLAQRDLRPNTQADYRSAIERYIIPVIGDTRLCDLDADLMQTFIDSVRNEVREHGKETGRNYSGARTALGVAAVLTKALALAVQRRYIPHNPMVGVMLPKHTRRKVTPVADALLADFLDAALKTRTAALWHMYALMGLRLGEGLGLRWAAYDRERRTIVIDQQVTRAGDSVALGEPKTDAGRRTLPVPGVVVDLLDAHWTAQQAERKAKGVEWKEHGLIFPTREGGPIYPRVAQEQFYRLRAKAGISATVSLHHLRHTTSTLLDEVGASEALKQGILGHGPKNISQHYTHARIEAMRKVLELVAERVLGKEQNYGSRAGT